MNKDRELELLANEIRYLNFIIKIKTGEEKHTVSTRIIKLCRRWDNIKLPLLHKQKIWQKSTYTYK